MADAIWFQTVDLAALNALHAGDINGHLGVEMTGFGPNWLSGRMPVDRRTTQPYGILHGGASVVLAETLGTAGANLTLDPALFICVGQEVNANHLRSVRAGFVHGRAQPFHLGRTGQVWGIELRDDEGRLTCVARLTIAVLPKPA
jgi:1,4-dihydroxy-2-naphthoyl-CoA hydrolase